MNIHLKNYLEIYQKFPLSSYLTREERSNRHKMLSDWGKEEVQEHTSLDELIDFMEQNKENININSHFLKKFEDVWRDDLKNGYKFATFLIGIDCAEILWKFDISYMNLVSQILKHNPKHTKALENKLKTLTLYHDFNLHELPLGVLTEKSLEEELKSVRDMEEVAKKLNYKSEDFDILISCCKTYYPLWFEYLKKGEKEGFENFLKAKGINTEEIYAPYILI